MKVLQRAWSLAGLLFLVIWAVLQVPTQAGGTVNLSGTIHSVDRETVTLKMDQDLYVLKKDRLPSAFLKTVETPQSTGKTMAVTVPFDAVKNVLPAKR